MQEDVPREAEDAPKLGLIGQMKLRLSGIVKQLSSPDMSKDVDQDVPDKKTLRHSDRAAQDVSDKKTLRHSNRVKKDAPKVEGAASPKDTLQDIPRVVNPASPKDAPQDVSLTSPKDTNPSSPKDAPLEVSVTSPKVLTTTSQKSTPQDVSNTSTLPCTQCSRYSFIYETGHIATRCVTHLKPCDGCKGPNKFGGGQAYMYCRKCCKGNEVLFYRDGYKAVE
jgi:hypothetical protein